MLNGHPFLVDICKISDGSYTKYGEVFFGQTHSSRFRANRLYTIYDLMKLKRSAYAFKVPSEDVDWEATLAKEWTAVDPLWADYSNIASHEVTSENSNSVVNEMVGIFNSLG